MVYEIVGRLSEYKLSLVPQGYGYFKLYDLIYDDQYETMSIWQISNLLDKWENA